MPLGCHQGWEGAVTACKWLRETLGPVALTEGKVPEYQGLGHGKRHHQKASGLPTVISSASHNTMQPVKSTQSKCPSATCVNSDVDSDYVHNSLHSQNDPSSKEFLRK